MTENMVKLMEEVGCKEFLECFLNKRSKCLLVDRKGCYLLWCELSSYIFLGNTKDSEKNIQELKRRRDLPLNQKTAA